MCQRHINIAFKVQAVKALLQSPTDQANVSSDTLNVKLDTIDGDTEIKYRTSKMWSAERNMLQSQHCGYTFIKETTAFRSHCGRHTGNAQYVPGMLEFQDDEGIFQQKHWEAKGHFF